jgi:hypothetical protein
MVLLHMEMDVLKKALQSINFDFKFKKIILFQIYLYFFDCKGSIQELHYMCHGLLIRGMVYWVVVNNLKIDINANINQVFIIYFTYL